MIHPNLEAKLDSIIHIVLVLETRKMQNLRPWILCGFSSVLSQPSIFGRVGALVRKLRVIP